jgi:hypothetical protein
VVVDILEGLWEALAAALGVGVVPNKREPEGRRAWALLR